MELKNSKRLLSLLLAVIMILGIMPISSQAKQTIGSRSVNTGSRALPGPNWGDDGESDETTDGDDLWPLPQGVSLINAQNGPDPLNTIGFTYKGQYTTDKGRQAVVLNVGQKQTVTSAVWQHYVMRFPGELFNKIDWENSFIVNKVLETGDVRFLKFTESPIPGQKKYTKSFSNLDAGIQYGHNEVNLVLKDGYTWDNTFANKNHVLQLRLFDSNGSRIFSTSVSERNARNGYKYTLPTYNSYTKAATIPGKSDLPKDWMLTTTTSLDNATADRFYTADSVLQLDKENGVVRVIYLKSNADGSTEYGYSDQELAIRQSFDRDFVKYLDLAKEDGQIGTIRTYRPNEKVYGDEIAIFPYHLNGVEKDQDGNPLLDDQNQPTYNRTDGSVFIQAATANYEDKHSTKEGTPSGDKVSIIKQAPGKGGNIRGDQTNEANITVFEYYIKPEIIEKELISSKTFVKNFFFDTRFITNNSRGMVKYTAKLDRDLVVPGGKDIFLNVSFTPELSLDAGTGLMARRNEQDFVINLGGTEGISKSWKRNGGYWAGSRGSYKYLIPTYGKGADQQTVNVPSVGYTIKAGEEITVYVPNEWNGSTNSAVFTVEKGTNYRNTSTVKYPGTTDDIKIELTKTEDVAYNPMYIPNSVSTIGGTAYRVKFPPIVNEIFTDGVESKQFTGYNKSSNGHIESQVKVGDSLYTGKYSFASDTSGKDGETLDLYTADGMDDLVKRDVADVVGRVTIDGETYNGFKFEIKQQFVNNTPNGSVENLELLKDMPVVFRSGNTSSLDSEPVVEQVQARIKFDWNIPTTDPEQVVEPLIKIAPLNKELLTHPLDVYEDNILVTKGGDNNQDYKPSGFEGDNVSFLNHNGVALEGEELAKRQFPGAETEEEFRTEYPIWQDDSTTANVNESQFKLLGWSTKQDTSAEDFSKMEELTDINQWNEETTYKFTAKSPIDKHRTVYAVWGEGSATPIDPTQNYDIENDVQFVEGSFDKKVATDSVVTLVREDSDNIGSYIPVLDAEGQAITGTISEDGNGFKINLRDGSINHIDQLDEITEYKVQLTEINKEPVVSEKGLKLDITAPTIELGLELDEMGLNAKLTGTTKDEKSKVIKVNVTNGNDSPIDVVLNDNGFNEVAIPLNGQAITYKAVAIDAMGNKSEEAEKTLDAVKEKVDLKMYASYVGENIIFVQSAAETNLIISIENNENVIKLRDQKVTTNDYEEIKLLREDGSEYKLQRRDRVVVKAENPNFESNSVVQRAR